MRLYSSNNFKQFVQLCSGLTLCFFLSYIPKKTSRKLNCFKLFLHSFMYLRSNCHEFFLTATFRLNRAKTHLRTNNSTWNSSYILKMKFFFSNDSSKNLLVCQDNNYPHTNSGWLSLFSQPFCWQCIEIEMRNSMLISLRVHQIKITHEARHSLEFQGME